MANKIFNTRVKNKRDTEANWKSKNPVLLDGEIIIVTTTSGDTRFKVGDGKKTYNQLPFQDQKTRDLIPSVDSSLSSTSTNPVQNKIIKSELDKKAERDVVNTTTNGLMSVADKKKLDGIDAGANKITVDTSLSSTSTNPVQNKVVNSAISNLNTLVGDTSVSTQITNAVANKVDKVSGKGLSANDYTTTEKYKLAGICENAEVNQNAFSNVVIGSTTISADSKTDTLTLVAGNNVTLTPDSTNDKITIAAKDTTYSAATTSSAGLMSASDKSKLDGIATGATKITVDTALSSTSTNPVQNKVINSALSGKAGTAVATTSANGLMSASDKSKLDGIASGATKIIIDTSLSGTSTNPV